ncbi:hypothetical protein AA12717_1377 [Gluconacetobacter sacchari DSM 12717]|uniref:Uncharacterized protein n=2 Tax=Gluconacetobacter sacchari TaxID=92759 RepID=A0A7W4IBD8_9PROT|nr:hypothetical protein [Gluconacetobacter sacchari]MBB2159698.1 hypothetical protein [Gluconacetobacter sacchari]GBQ23060.1 hypothetical protein AA12717_1377 [Gluconacetobacter sacchari DSM 12717]
MFRHEEPSEAVRLELIRAATRLTEKHLEMRERLLPLQPPEQQSIQRLELWAASYMTTIWSSILDQLEREWHSHVQGDHWPYEP